MLLSIVVPVYREEKNIPEYLRRVRPILGAITENYEIIFALDPSPDRTEAVILEERASDPRIKLLKFSRRFGQPMATLAGMQYSRGDAVIVMDVDLQDPPELIAEFITRWEDGYDVVYGARASRRADSRLKRLTAAGFYRIFGALSDVAMAPGAGDFRLMDRSVVEVLKAMPERNRFMKGLFAWVGFRQIGVPYHRPQRVAGASAWRYWKLWNFALDGLTSFSTVPLRVWTYVGGVTALAAFAYAFFLIAQTVIHGRDVPGYASLMVAVLMSFGLQMLAIGIVGEYLGRVFQEVKRRPLYVARERYGFEDA